MKASLSAPGFNDRLVPRFPAAPSQAAAAPSGTSPDGDPFAHFTESCPAPRHAPPAEQDIASAEAGATAFAGAVFLSEHTLILLRAVASYERCSNEHAIDLALADYATKIGAGPLARAVLDERELVVGRRLPGPFDDVPDDLGDLPEFTRRDQMRFSRAREALGNKTRGLRR